MVFSVGKLFFISKLEDNIMEITIPNYLLL